MYIKIGNQIVVPQSPFQVARTNLDSNHGQFINNTLLICKKEVSSKHCIVTYLSDSQVQVLVSGTNDTYYNKILISKNVPFNIQETGKLTLKNYDILEIIFQDPSIMLLKHQFPKLIKVYYDKFINFSEYQLQILKQTTLTQIVLLKPFYQYDKPIDIHQNFKITIPPLKDYYLDLIDTLPNYSQIVQFLQDNNIPMSDLRFSTPLVLFLLNRSQLYGEFQIKGRFSKEFGSNDTGCDISLDDENLSTYIIVPQHIFFLSIYFCDTTILQGFIQEKTVAQSQLTILDQDNSNQITENLSKNKNQQKYIIQFSDTESDSNSNIFECIKRASQGQNINQINITQNKSNEIQSLSIQENNSNELFVQSNNDSSDNIFIVKKQKQHFQNNGCIQETPNPIDSQIEQKLQNQTLVNNQQLINQLNAPSQLIYPPNVKQIDSQELSTLNINSLPNEPKQKILFNQFAQFDISKDIPLQVKTSQTFSLYKNSEFLGNLKIELPPTVFTEIKPETFDQIQPISYQDFLNQ
ncbi:hypothetical protein SS50377_27604 [Spironucleus salmonicida]|uniref:FHA domain-containing protein n=1 Tax=Spironucleus salmonicida TaxID=348837 RepID=V6LQU4_9EUKA|nr:hypothetical protein SS50377_27604 [Spironucleus salmonicida]|eukprot:EST46618.1 Hypothetical protein SS50377_13422 [Spironucleus salmonicida]